MLQSTQPSGYASSRSPSETETHSPDSNDISPPLNQSPAPASPDLDNPSDPWFPAPLTTDQPPVTSGPTSAVSTIRLPPIREPPVREPTTPAPPAWAPVIPQPTGHQLNTNPPRSPPSEDAYLISDGSIREDFKQYNEGRKLVLRYQTPRRPYGLSEYPNPPGIESDDKALSKEEIELTRTALVYHDRYISDHTPGPVEAKVDLTVVDNISGGVGAGTQILLCKVEDTQYDGDTEICNNGKMQSDSSIRHFFNDTARRVKQACDAILSPWRQDAENAGDAGPSEDQKQEKSVLSERPTLIGDRLVLGQLVVVKVYDAMFYPGGMHQGLWKATSIADQEHSREAGTYSHLWTENKTGKLQITPQFYGSWAIELTTVNQQVSQKKRFARSIMIEHVKGTSIENLCRRTYKGNHLIVRNQGRPEMADGTEFIFDEDFRLGVLQRLIDGYVNLLHVGVWLRIDPEDVLLTGKDGDVLLDKPRVVLIDYVNAQSDSQFKKPNNIYQPWKMPPHPFGEFSMEKMIHFSGWYNHLWTTHHFDRWMKQVFGQLDDPRYTSPMVSKAFIDEIGTEDTGLPA